MLSVENIHTYYGDAQVLHGVSLKVERGRIRHSARKKRRRQIDNAQEHYGNCSCPFW